MLARGGLRTRAMLGPRASVRLSSHVSYGPAEPLGPYIKWTAALCAGVGLVAYDRLLSDKAITKWLTPSPSYAEEIAKQRERFADRQITEQDRAITLLHPAPRSVTHETFSARPVPEGSYRAAHTNDVLDPSTLGERRGRTQVFKE